MKILHGCGHFWRWHGWPSLRQWDVSLNPPILTTSNCVTHLLIPSPPFLCSLPPPASDRYLSPGWPLQSPLKPTVHLVAGVSILAHNWAILTPPASLALSALSHLPAFVNFCLFVFQGRHDGYGLLDLPYSLIPPQLLSQTYSSFKSSQKTRLLWISSPTLLPYTYTHWVRSCHWLPQHPVLIPF